MEIVNLTGVRKSYRRLGSPRVAALDGLDLAVPEGGVHGFLGPNGSGKTTTLRILLGLVSTDHGEVRLFGHRVPDALPRVLAHVGSLIETPRLFPQWGGRYNLQVLATMARLTPVRVEECLELVGMREHGDAPFKSCSLGMKQRLGIAAALLKDPRLLILDEPGNGLDPAGIREMRDLIKALGAGSRTTVFVSSHQLGEIEQMCDRVSILSHGRLVASGEVPDIMNRHEVLDVLVRTDDLETAREVLLAAGFHCAVRPDGLLVSGAADPALVSRVLAARGQFVSALIPQETSLESSFLELTRETPPAEVSR